MSKKNFISFLGTAQINEGRRTYRETIYEFKEGRQIKAKCFAEAVLQSQEWNFDKVILIGTKSSIWETLFEKADDVLNNTEDSALKDDAENLGLELLEKQESAFDDPTVLGRMQDTLERIWKLPFEIHLHRQELTSENDRGIYDEYLSCILNDDSDVLLDITHGFRWMPVLFVSALGFRDAFWKKNNNIEIIYGEYDSERRISPVRYADILIKEQRISRAISLFFQKFEAQPLEDELTDIWPSGAKAIKELGANLLGAYIIPLLVTREGNANNAISMPGKPIKQMKKALDDLNNRVVKQEYIPGWLFHVRDELSKLIRKMTNGKSVWENCKNIAEIYADRKMFGFACLSMAIAQEQVLLQHMEAPADASYEDRKEIVDNFVKRWRESKKSHLTKCFMDSKRFRNGVAHCGISSRQGGQLQAGYLPRFFESAKTNLKMLVETLLSAETAVGRTAPPATVPDVSEPDRKSVFDVDVDF